MRSPAPATTPPDAPHPADARDSDLVDALACAGAYVLADRDCPGAEKHVRAPYRGRHLPAELWAVDAAQARLRTTGERVTTACTAISTHTS